MTVCWTKIEMQLERVQGSVLGIDERDKRATRWTRSQTKAREHFPNHFNTTTTRRHYNHDNLYSSTLFANTANLRTTLLTGLCCKSKAGEAATRERTAHFNPRNTTYTRIAWATLDTTRVPRDSHDLRSLYMTLRCIYHANSSASCTSTCNETHTHFLRLFSS